MPPSRNGVDKSPVPDYASAGGGYVSGTGISSLGKSYSIMPFVPRLRAWIQRQKKMQRRDLRKSSRGRTAQQPQSDMSSGGSESDIESGLDGGGTRGSRRKDRKVKGTAARVATD